jgi:putative ABC transport system permease protein
VSPLVSSQKQVIYGSKNTNTTINGVAPAYATVNNTSVTSGIFISEENSTNRDKVAVIGPTIVENLFGSEDPL